MYAGGARGRQCSAALRADRKLLFVNSLHAVVGFIYVTARGDGAYEPRGGFTEGVDAECVTEDVHRLSALQLESEKGVAVHTLVLSRFDFIKRNGPAEVVGVDLVGVDLFLTYEQHVATIFGFDRNIAHYGKKIGECRVFTGAKLFHFFIAQSRVDQEFFHCSVLRRVVPA